MDKESFSTNKIQYNSPLILTYAIASLVVLILGFITLGRTTSLFFMVYRSPLTDPLSYFRIFLHVLGHADFNHYFNNFLIILLIGPMIEEKYGSITLLFMILFTALITGLIHILVAPNTGLLGASGVVFMLILLSSYTNFERGKIPLTLILVIVIFLGREFFNAIFMDDSVSRITHLVGGFLGALMGFFINRNRELV